MAGAWGVLVCGEAGDDGGLEQCFERIKKFVAPRVKRLLVVEDNEVESQSIVELLHHDDIEIVTVGTGARR